MLGFSLDSYVVFLIFLLGHLAHAEDSSCGTSDLDLKCAAFCYKIFKPVLLDTNDFREQIEEYKEKYHDVDKKIEKMQQNATQQQSVINYQKDQIADLTIKQEQYKDIVKDKENHIKTLESQIELINKINKSEHEQKDTKINSLESQGKETVRVRDNEIKALKSQIEDIDKKNKQFYEEIKNLKSELNIKNDLISSTQKEVTLLKSNSEAASRELNLKSHEIDSVRSHLQSRDAQIAEYKQQVDKKNKEIKSLKSELNGKNNLIHSTQKEVILLKSNSEDAARELNLKSNEVASVRSDLQSRDVQISEYRKKAEKCSAESCLSFGDSNDLQAIKIPGMGPFVAPCESRIAGPGWMVIQRRIDGSVDFKRKWVDYKHGFGDVNGEFWLGLERIHQITTSRRYELYVQSVKEKDQGIKYGHYNNFVIGSESEQYKLTAVYHAGHNGLWNNIGSKFSTIDRDNDDDKNFDVAGYYGGAWWYKNGTTASDLNSDFHQEMWWGEKIISCQMLIRPWQPK